MATKEQVMSEVERVPEERLAELYEIVRSFARPEPAPGASSLMSKLKAIRIDAPTDFSENIDSYLNGERTVE